MGKRDKKGMVLIVMGVLALISAIQYNVSRAYRSQEEFGSDEFASLAKSKVTRQTELGQPVKSQNSSNKEIDLLLADPAMSQKWDISSTQTQEAWQKHRAFGDSSVKVCVIDTGADVNHPDLKANLWKNLGEVGKDSSGRDRAKNGVDDDNNGCIDDVNGCNFISNTGDVTDRHGHGTHIAGIIGAVGGNGIGISGVARKVSLMIAKYYDPNSAANNNLVNTVRAIRYCVAMKADIINYSGGGLESSDKEREAISLAREKGILFVAAAGNEQSNSDFKKYFPADYDLDNIISVTAFDREKNVLPSSNFGVLSVDIAAPGKNIYSTLPGGSYGYMTGTSQATAVVTGVAVLLKARFKDFDPSRIIRHITETGDLEPVKLAGKTRNQKRLNTYRALAIIDQGMTVSGAIPQNTGNLDSAQFSVTSRDLTKNGTSTTIAPESLAGFGQDLRQLILEKEARRTR